MKKLFLTLVACIVAIAANAASVYFQNTSNWNKVAAYCWTGTGSGWPGTVITKTITADNGITYFVAETNEANIIFNNNGGGQQTKDLNVSDGAVFTYAANNNNNGTTDQVGTIKLENGVYKFTKAGEVVLTEGKLYFPVSLYDKPQAYFYSWEPQVTEGWPGTKLTKETLNGINFWVFTTKDDREITNKTLGGAQLNTGDNTAEVQVNSVAINPGYYINILTGASGPVADYKEGETPTTILYLVGDCTDWQKNSSFAFTDNGDNTYTLKLASLNGGFKVFNGNWDDINLGGDGQNQEGVTEVAAVIGDNTLWQGSSVNLMANNLTNVVLTLNYTLNAQSATLNIKADGGDIVDPDPTPDAMYIIGEVVEGGWGPTNGVAMNDEGDGIYTYEFTVDKTSYFGFASKLGANADDWNTLNANRYIPAQTNGEGHYLLSASDFSDGEVELDVIKGKDVSWGVPAGTYTVTFSLEDMILAIEGTPEEGGDVPTPGEEKTIYLRGDVNEWGTGEAYAFVKGTDGTYSLKLDALTGTFKLASEDWKTVDLGGDAQNQEGVKEVDAVLGNNTLWQGSSVNLTAGNWTNVELTLTYTYGENSATLNIKADASDTPVVPTPDETIYLVGAISANADGDWEFLPQYAFNMESDGKYTLKVDALDGQFKVATSDWETVNLGGDANGADVPFVNAVIGDNTLFQGSKINLMAGNAWTNVVLTLDYAGGESATLTIAADVNTDIPQTDWYVAGDFNSWGKTLFASESNGVLSTDVIPELMSFKLVNNGTWYGLDGAAALNTPMKVGEGDAYDNFTFGGNTVKNAVIAFNPTAMTVTVTGTLIVDEAPVELYIRGAVNDWGTSDMWKMNYNEATSTYTFVAYEKTEIPANSEFKIGDSTWNKKNLGAGAEGSVVPFDTNFNIEAGSNPGNLKFDEAFIGTITLTLTEKGATIFCEYDETVGVAGIEADGAEAEYFNLQGVKVANPEKGIFIKVANGKASKVVL